MNNNLFLDHLSVEYGTEHLNERFGYSVSVNAFVNKFISVLDKKGFFDKANAVGEIEAEFTPWMNESNIHGWKNNNIFDDFYIKIKIIMTEGYGKYAGRGGYFADKSILEFERDSDGNLTGEVFFRPYIEIEILSDSPERSKHILRSMLSHELTHAYNDYGTFVESGGKKRLSYTGNVSANRKALVILSQKESDSVQKLVANVIYHLQRPERNAYFAQLKGELNLDNMFIPSKESALSAIKKTDAYKKVEDLKRNAKALIEYLSGDEAEYAVNIMSNILNRKFTQNSARKWIEAHLEHYVKKFMITSSKIAYDVLMKRINGANTFYTDSEMNENLSKRITEEKAVEDLEIKIKNLK